MLGYISIELILSNVNLELGLHADVFYELKDCNEKVLDYWVCQVWEMDILVILKLQNFEVIVSSS